MVNRLAESASDYLRLHSAQPVDWWEWSDEAFEEARRRDVPILLSIGYASCHWCHVMSEESFADVEIAKQINHHFVPIKVDRQQLPDVDAAYLTVTQAMNGGVGGWPMTLFLTPQGAAFFAGTYFPPSPQPGQPSFSQVLAAMIDAWDTRRERLESTAEYVTNSLAALTPELPDDAPQPRQALEQVQASFDAVHGGFGSAPKFPMPTLIDALLVKGDRQSLDIAQRTLESMARGGIHDQVGGGFHRYSVDAGWVVPHFEKMLYDNALLLGTYLRGWRRTADHDSGLRALLERTAYGIVEFVQRELCSPQGAFYSALDADSTDIRGSVHEGIFYVWTPELLIDALGEEDGQWAIDMFHVTNQGTFEHGLSTLQLRNRPDWKRLDSVCERLLAERDNRFRPATDKLVVASWNAWMISSLTTGAMLFDEPSWLELALRAAQYLVDVHCVGGELRRSSYEAQAHEADAGAEDYGAVAEAFSLLAGVTGDASWLRRAQMLLETALSRFSAEDGGFYDAVDSGRFPRPRALTDNVTPSGTSALIAALRHVGLLAERPDFLARADQATRTTWATIRDNPALAGAALSEMLIDDEARRGLERAIAVVVSDDPFDELARAAWRLAPAGSVVLRAPAGTTGFGTHLEGREQRAVWVCRGTVCFAPVDEYPALKTPLWSRA